MKLCKDCEWSHADGSGDRFMECRAPQNIVSKEPKPITALISGTMIYEKGEKTYRWIYCSTQRDDGFIGSMITRSCGKRGRWWKPK